MARREFPTRVKVAAFTRCGGKCEGCGARLAVGGFAYDHDNPDGLTGEPTLENCKVLCRVCHAEKTRGDVAAIAQAKRREARHLGARASKRLMPFGRASGLKKKIDGTVVRRER